MTYYDYTVCLRVGCHRMFGDTLLIKYVRHINDNRLIMIDYEKIYTSW